MGTGWIGCARGGISCAGGSDSCTGGAGGTTGGIIVGGWGTDGPPSAMFNYILDCTTSESNPNPNFNLVKSNWIYKWPTV